MSVVCHDGRLCTRSRSLFATLPHRVRADLATICQSQRHAAGSCIFREGEHVDQIFFIRSGDVALEMDVPRRGRQRLLSLGVGDLLGWSPLFSQAGMTATAILFGRRAIVAAGRRGALPAVRSRPRVGLPLHARVALSLCQRLGARGSNCSTCFATTLPPLRYQPPGSHDEPR